MILNSTQRLLAARQICCLFSGKLLKFKFNELEKKLPLDQSHEKSAIQQDKAYHMKNYKQYTKQIYERLYSNLAINFQTQEEKVPIILSNKSKKILHFWDLAFLGSAGLFTWLLWTGTASYLTLGLVGGLTTLIMREGLIEWYKQQANQLVSLWKIPDGNYQVYYYNFGDSIQIKKKIIKPAEFKYNVGYSATAHPLFTKFIQYKPLKKLIPKTTDNGIWCAINDEAFWLNSNSKINNHLFHSLL